MSMMNKLNILKKIWTPFTKSSAGPYASAACYYLLLSLPPTAILSVTLLPVLSISEQHILSLLRTAVPAPFISALETIIQFAYEQPSPGFISLSTLAAIWSSAKGISSILEGFRAVLELPRYNFVKRRFWAILLLVGLLAAVFIAVLLLSAAVFILSAAARLLLPSSESTDHSAVRWMFSFGLLTVIITAVYRLSCRTAKLRHIIAASSAAAAAWIIVCMLFSLYLRFGSAEMGYLSGSSLLFAGMLWLRTVILVLLYGAILCDLLAQDKYHPISIIKKVLRPVDA